jgi:hypothetical protein
MTSRQVTPEIDAAHDQLAREHKRRVSGWLTAVFPPNTATIGTSGRWLRNQRSFVDWAGADRRRMNPRVSGPGRRRTAYGLAGA